MATSITVLCRFRDGTVGTLVNDDVTAGFTGEEITTGGTGLAQVTGTSLGNAFPGKVLTHAVGIASTQGAGTASGIWGSIRDAKGTVVAVFPVGGQHADEMPPLYREIPMATGMSCHAAWQAQSDSATLVASLSVCYTDGSADYFGATMVDATKTELLNKDGSTLGAAGQNKVIAKAYACYGGTLGLSENQGGNNFLYIEGPDGQLKAAYPVGGGSGANKAIFNPVMYPVSVSINDGLFGMSDT